MDTFEQLGEDFLALVTTQAQEIGVELTDDLQGAAQFASERAAHLSTIVGEPGFSEALTAERDAVALRVTSAAIDRADALDQRFQAFIAQVLQFGARALAIAVPG